MKRNILVFASLGLAIIGFAIGYATRGTCVSLVLYHVGGLGALGLLACASGAIAQGKGHGYWWGFLSALSLSVVLGLIGAYLVPPKGLEGRPAACGGSVSLLVGLIVIAYWAIRRKKSGEPAA